MSLSSGADEVTIISGPGAKVRLRMSRRGQLGVQSLKEYYHVQKYDLTGRDPFPDAMLPLIPKNIPVYVDKGERYVEKMMRALFFFKQVALIGPSGCITGESVISTEDGKFIRIEDLARDLIPGVYIADLPVYPPGRAVALHVYDVPETYELITETGKRLRTTPNHPLMTRDGWKEAKDLQLGDEVKVIRWIPSPASYVKFDEYVSSYRMKERVVFPNIWDESVAELFGVFLAEGTADKSDKRVSFTISETELDFAARIKELTKLVFKLECGTTPQRKTHAVKVRINSKIAYNLFSKYWGPNEKHIPSPILLSPNTVLGAFLRGLFEGDGGVLNLRERYGVHPGPKHYKRLDINQGAKLTSNSRIFLEEVQTTLLRFSIVSRIYDKPSTRKNGHRTPTYDLRVYGRDNLQKFADNIGFISNRKQTKLQDTLASYKRNASRIYLNGDYEKLVSTKKIDEWKKVYDFEVPRTHAFFSNGILSHNTGKSITKDQHMIAEFNGKMLNIPVEEFFDYMKTKITPESDPLGWEVIKFGNSVKVPAMNPKTQQLEWKRVYGLARTEHSGKVITIRTKNNRTLTATPDHSFMTETGVVNAENLKIGMRVPIVRHLPEMSGPHQTEINLSEYIEEPIVIENTVASGMTTALRQNRTPLTIPLNPESAWFFGFFVAEGTLDPNGRTMSIFNNNTQYVHKTTGFLRTIGVEPSTRKILIGGAKRYGIEIRVRNKNFAQFLKKTTVENTSIKTQPGWASCKKVPEFIFNADTETKRAFLKGLWDGDGCLDKDLGFVIGTSSGHLAQGIMTIAESIGCFPSVRIDTQNSAPYYTVVLGRDSGLDGELTPYTRARVETVKVTREMIDEARRAYEKLPKNTEFYRKYVASFYPEGINVSFQALKERANALKSLKLMEMAKSNTIWDTIEKIDKSDYDDYVYDFEVPGSETFVAGFGNLITHNTHITYLVAELAGLPMYEVNCGLQTSVYDLFGRFIGLGKSNWVDGQIVTWCRAGGILYLDEANMMKQDVATRLNPILDTRGHLVLNEKDNEIIERNKRGYVIISMNPFSSEFAGTKPLNAAFRRRMSVWLNFDYLSVGSVISDEEVELVVKKSHISRTIALKIVEVGAELRKQYKTGDLPYGPSVSDLYNWATLIADGLTPLDAAEQSIISLSSDDAEIQAIIRRICTAKFT